MGEPVRLRIPVVEALAIAGQKTFATVGRELNPEERRLLLSIFGDSVNLDPVQIVLTDLGIRGRPYTTGNTIRVPRATPFSPVTLVHEMTHVWQFQTRGTRYISDSLVHQLVQGDDAYVVDLVPGQSIFDYAAEQQARIVERYYLDAPPGWSNNADVVRMIGEVKATRRLSNEEIQRETWFGPGPGPLDKLPPSSGANSTSQTVPLLRIEF